MPGKSDLHEFEDGVVAGLVAAHCADSSSPLYGRDVQEIMAMIEPKDGVERMLEVGIRGGQWGDWFGQREGLTLAKMADNPNGVDYGEIRAGRLSEVVQHPENDIDLAPAVILDELRNLTEPGDSFVLVGRRNTRTNNSWLRNIPMLGKGKALCVLEMHPEDAAELGLNAGQQVQIANDTASLQLPVQLTEDIARGVVCMPHGFARTAGLQQRNLQQGENYNRLAKASNVDRPSGTAALNGIPVELSPC